MFYFCTLTFRTQAKKWDQLQSTYSQLGTAELFKTIHILYVFLGFFIRQPKSFALIFTPTRLKIVLYSFCLKENLSVVEIFLLTVVLP